MKKVDVTYTDAIEADAMESHPWQQRAKAAGLSQKMLAKLLGHAEMTVSRQLRGHWESGVPQHVRAAIIAWELMTPDLREAWLDANPADMKRVHFCHSPEWIARIDDWRAQQRPIPNRSEAIRMLVDQALGRPPT